MLSRASPIAVPDLPKFHEFMTPLLLVLQANGEMYRQDATDAVIKSTGLTPEQVAITHETSGNSIVRNRIGWASSYLKVAGAIASPKRAHWQLGVNAASLLALGRPATLADLKSFPEYQAHQARKAEQSLANSSGKDDIVSSDSTPEELIEEGITALRDGLVVELLENLKTCEPARFERIVLQVLAAMGYGGGDMRSMQGVPRGPDGGIDGRINEDKLGLDQIYIQAKRYADNSVGRPIVQSFLGAMDHGGCSKGVFVTSSKFTADARDFANGLTTKRLKLIDGLEFAKLMIEYCVGVQIVRTIPISKLDNDFFGDDE